MPWSWRWKRHAGNLPAGGRGKRSTSTLETAEESIQKKVVLYDKEGDYHFDTISAFIKSIRGSDPDAALYWMAKMIRAGEDPKYLFRRMLISACEDIGIADPNAHSCHRGCCGGFRPDRTSGRTVPPDRSGTLPGHGAEI